MFELKKYRGVISHEIEEGCKTSTGINSSFQNWHNKFDKIWPGQSEVSKNFILMGSFSAKYITFEVKKYTGIMLHETEEGYKIWREIDLSFQNWHKKFYNFLPDHS